MLIDVTTWVIVTEAVRLTGKTERTIRVFELVPFGKFLINTLNIMFWNILGNVIVTSPVAYSFARLRYPGRNVLFHTKKVKPVRFGHGREMSF